MRVKALILVFFATNVACVIMGCSYRYSVVVENAGDKIINVSIFRIGTSKDSEVLGGIIIDHGQKSCGPIIQKPKQKVILQWTQGGIVKQATIYMQLPKDFTPARGKRIRFVVDPAKGTVETKYDVIDPPNDDWRTIEGATFRAD